MIPLLVARGAADAPLSGEPHPGQGLHVEHGTVLSRWWIVDASLLLYNLPGTCWEELSGGLLSRLRAAAGTTCNVHLHMCMHARRIPARVLQPLSVGRSDGRTISR